jgi:endoglucanase
VRYDDLNIPESGNGVPDLLDEARFELRWFLGMQDTTDGGVYFKVTTLNFDAFEMPSQDISTRYIYQKTTTATGDFAAVMAQAARIYQPFDAAFSSQCLIAARKAWQYLQANASIVPTGGFHNPSGTGTGEYGDGSDADERLWAAAELFVTTGEDAYHNYFKNHYNDNGLFTPTMGWQNVLAMAHLAYLTGKQPLADSTIKAQLSVGLTNCCSNLLATVTSDGLNVCLKPSDYGWGSNGFDLNNAVIMIAGYLSSGNHDFYVAALQQLNYVLGCNRLNMTFVTGVGSASPMHIHHRPSGSDGIVNPVPGLMSGGPDSHLEDAVLAARFNNTTPPAACYADDQGSYASNEIAINWNAPLVFVSGFFNESPATSVYQDVSRVPLQYSLDQNFPNPFNPTTNLRFALPSASFVTLKVYDLLGRELATIVNGNRAAGTYTVSWDASAYPSGVYFCRMQGGNFVVTKKMSLVK